MDRVFDLTTKTGEIVKQLPQASTVLKRYRIDFCCGGNRPIGEVIKEKQLNSNEILDRLHEVYMKSIEKHVLNWDEVSSSEIIHHIVHDYHADLEVLLPELSQFTTKVHRVHGNDCEELKQVHQLFHELKEELEQHTIEEENQVFPLIKEFMSQPTNETIIKKMSQKIDELMDDHEGAGQILAKLREVTNNFTVPDWACMTFELTYQKLEKLESDLFEHIHLENNVLFPRVLKKLKEVH